MATLDATRPTLWDVAKRTAPDGSIQTLAELHGGGDAGRAAAYRASEDKAYLEAMNQRFQRTTFELHAGGGTVPPQPNTGHR